tara:strand:+ start:1139 stop:1522 length:384 start_codon:yes stop_codon:yes gene_type:complete
MIKIIEILIILIILFIFYKIIKVEFDDRKAVNDNFHKIRNNKECINHIKIINSFPIWRLCLFFSLLLSIFITLFFYYLVKPKKDKVILLFIFTLFINMFVLNKFLNHWNWHYVSNDGGIENKFFTKK